MNASGRQCTVWLFIPSESKSRSRIKPGTPKIQPSTCATVRSGSVSSGFRNAARLPFRSARDSQAAMQNASCWSPCSPLLGKAAAPQRWIDFGDSRTFGRDIPAVERPEMDAGPEPLADIAQPGDAGMRGFRHRPLYVELKDRFRAARAFLSQPPPAGIAHPRRTITHRALTYEINVGVILVGRPMALEIVEEGRPVGLQAMHLEVAQRKRKAVVDADQRGRVLGQLVYQPFGDTASRPVFLRGWRRQNLDRRYIAARPDRLAGPSDLRSASPRLNSRCRSLLAA